MSTEQQPDEFMTLVQGLEEDMSRYLAYDERTGCYTIALDDDMAHLRRAFHDHIKTLFDAEPGYEIRHEEYEYIEYIMNTSDSRGLRELAVDDLVATDSEAVMIYHDEDANRMAYVVVADDERVVGEYQAVTVVPSPSVAMILEGESNDESSPELAVILLNPRVETSDGDIQSLHVPAAMIPILDPSVRLVKRVYGEETL